MSYVLEVSIDEIVDIYTQKHTVASGEDTIRKAYDYASKKHAGVKRGTGEPYICHCLRTARQLAELGFNYPVISAGILHDVLEDSDATYEDLKKEFGKDIAGLVDCVTSLSDKDYKEHTLTKAQKNLLSDIRLQSKMNARALYIKLCDRVDNLNTLSGVPEAKRIPKCEHTREIIIPMLEYIKAYHFVSILEELCFKTEHVSMYEDILREFEAICEENSRSCKATIDTLSSVFDPMTNNETKELEKEHRFILGFSYAKRSCISIYRQIAHMAINIDADWKKLLTKKNIPLYDMYLIIDDELLAESYGSTPNDVFFSYFEKSLSKRGFYLQDYLYTTHKDAKYFLLVDEMDNRYRLFVRTRTESDRYTYGNIIDEDGSLLVQDVNHIDPRESYNEKITVFVRNGNQMLIDKGATVLDLAFYLDENIGYHFEYAQIDDCEAELPADTRLNDGDKITIKFDNKITPNIDWFMNVRTVIAASYLVDYFRTHGLQIEPNEKKEV